MDKKLLTAAVVGAAAVAGAVVLTQGKPNTPTIAGEPAHVHTDAPPPGGKEECFGVAKAGENGCAAANGSHTCGGLAKLDYSGQEWMLVDAGTCGKMGGKLEAFEDPATGPVAPHPQDVKPVSTQG